MTESNACIALRAILLYAGEDQKQELLKWIDQTAGNVMMSKTVGVISDADWGKWLKIRGDWEKSKRQDDFKELLNSPKAVWKELRELEGGDCHE